MTLFSYNNKIILPILIFCKKIIYSSILNILPFRYILQYKYNNNLDNLVIIRSDPLFASFSSR